MSKPKRHMNQMYRREAVAGYLCLLPNFLGFAVFTVIPVIMGFIISLTNYSGFLGYQFVGMSNYIAMFRDRLFLDALVNNIVYAFLVVPLTLLAALLLALALNRKVKLNGFFKTVYFFPNLTSMVAIGCVAMMVFQPSGGIVNQFLEWMGVAEENLPKWFNSTATALLTVVIVVVWKTAGYYMIMFLGGLKSIPSHLYEAAKIDGANSWQCFWNVTWPMLSPTTFMVTILCFISSFQVFDIIQITTSGGPGRATTVLVYRIYKEAFQNWKMGYASAIAYFLFLIIFVITVIQWRGQKKWVNELGGGQMKKKIKASNVILFIVCVLVAAIMLIPFIWMLSASFQQNTEIFRKPFRWLPELFRLENYKRVWTQVNFLKYYLNTVKVTVISVAIQVLTCSLAAFAFTKLKFPGRDQIFFAYIATMMVPWNAIMIPQFIIIKNMGLYNTHAALILIGSFNAFGVFLLRQNMLSIPGEMNEAAKIDGCGVMRTYWNIIMPLSKGAVATLIILQFNQVWNDYMAPMIYLDSDSKKTIQLGLASFKQQYSADYGAIMAGTVCAVIPIIIVYAFAQKYIIEGMAHTGVKG